MLTIENLQILATTDRVDYEEYVQAAREAVRDPANWRRDGGGYLYLQHVQGGSREARLHRIEIESHGCDLSDCPTPWEACDRVRMEAARG